MPSTRSWAWIALVCGGCAAIWILLQDRTIRLEEVPANLAVPPSAAPAATADSVYALYNQKRYAEALAAALPLAEAGSPTAQCVAGLILATGVGGVAADHVEGAKWVDLCMRAPETEKENGPREAMNYLIETAGWDVVGEGKYRAFQWQQAAINTERGEPGSAPEGVLRDLATLDGDAAFELGVKLNKGQDSPVDYEKALLCFKRAAEFALPAAHFNLGVAYYAGKGVKADPQEAAGWFKRAADAGYAKAATSYGIMAARGDGMAQDTNLALEYLGYAAKQGDPEAPFIREAVAAGNIPD